MNGLPLVSAIITTKNEGANLDNCLASIKKQNYPPEKIEIIVVDNNSTDKTKSIAEKYTDLVFNKGPERSAQRNFGVEKSIGEYFIYLDADMILSKDLIKDCVSIIQNSDIVGLYISEIVTGKSFWSRVRRFERSFYDGTVIDGVRFIKKLVFQKVGGFDEKMYACEDWDLTKKLKKEGAIKLIKTPIYHNEAEFSLKKYLAKKGYYSGNLHVYLSKWGQADPDLKKQFNFSYRFFGVFMENDKWKRAVLHPILFTGIFILRFLVGLTFLIKKNES